MKNPVRFKGMPVLKDKDGNEIGIVKEIIETTPILSNEVVEQMNEDPGNAWRTYLDHANSMHDDAVDATRWAWQEYVEAVETETELTDSDKRKAVLKTIVDEAARIKVETPLVDALKRQGLISDEEVRNRFFNSDDDDDIIDADYTVIED